MNQNYKLGLDGYITQILDLAGTMSMAMSSFFTTLNILNQENLM